MATKPINESVLLTATNHGWDAGVIDLGRIDEAQNDRIKRLIKILKSGHYGIVSPHRSFPYHHDLLHKGMRPLGPEEDAGKAKNTYKGDENVRRFMGSDTLGGSKGTMKLTHNAQAFTKLRQTIATLGFNPLIATGAWGEAGGKVGTEASLIIPGTAHTGTVLTQPMLASLARRYNQDGFIYAGPETDNEAHLYLNTGRSSKSGLPISYDEHFSIGHPEKPAEVREMIRRLHANPPDKIEGMTQPRGHGEMQPSDVRFGTKPGKGRATTITTDVPGKEYL